MSKILLSASHIVQYFSDRKILEFEKLTVYEGDRIGIVGVNGAGKTTLLNILSGELTPDEGSVIREAPVSYFKQFRERTEEIDPRKSKELGISGKLTREKLSGGEMTRLGLAAMEENALLPTSRRPTWTRKEWSFAAGCWSSALPCFSSATTGRCWTGCAPGSLR